MESVLAVSIAFNRGPGRVGVTNVTARPGTQTGAALVDTLRHFDYARRILEAGYDEVTAAEAVMRVDYDSHVNCPLVSIWGDMRVRVEYNGQAFYVPVAVNVFTEHHSAKQLVDLVWQLVDALWDPILKAFGANTSAGADAAESSPEPAAQPAPPVTPPTTKPSSPAQPTPLAVQSDDSPMLEWISSAAERTRYIHEQIEKWGTQKFRIEVTGIAHVIAKNGVTQFEIYPAWNGRRSAYPAGPLTIWGNNAHIPREVVDLLFELAPEVGTKVDGVGVLTVMLNVRGEKIYFNPTALQFTRDTDVEF